MCVCVCVCVWTVLDQAPPALPIYNCWILASMDSLQMRVPKTMCLCDLMVCWGCVLPGTTAHTATFSSALCYNSIYLLPLKQHNSAF